MNKESEDNLRSLDLITTKEIETDRERQIERDR